MKGRPAPTDFWAKLNRDAEGTPTEWHPLECHLADVAACTKALLKHTILRQRFAVLVGRELTNGDIDRFTFLAAIHDVGKVNNGFQGQAQPGVAIRAGHVSPLIDALDESTPEDMCDQIVGALHLRELLAWFTDENDLADWFLTTIAHHGQAVEPRPRFKRALWEKNAVRDPIRELASLVAIAKEWVPAAFEPAEPLPRNTELQHAFNGLLTLADWLGSDVQFFPFATEKIGRFEWACRRAEDALDKMGLRVHCARSSLGEEKLGFSNFTTFAAPNDLQQKCLELPADARPSLVIAESDTGSGKTEAAFARFVSLFQAGVVDGMYFALPTRSAATQMFQRVTKMTARLFPKQARPAVVLAVPGYIAVDDVNAIRLPGFKVQWPDDPADRWRYRGWAAENTKRYLAGTIVVGTIDQALLSVLQVKHAHLRSTALLRHLLVIDEVHASDAYMTRLSEEVLRTHLAAHGHAFLMSATLGNTALSRYFKSAALPVDDAIDAPYPSITYRFGTKTGQIECSGTGYDKSVEMETSAIADAPEALATSVTAAVAAGARVLIIRNTVRDCVQTFETLERILPPDSLMTVGGTRAPHHARFAKVDREALDNAVEACLGKTSDTRGIVVIATQTVEQSLDIDADVLFTDLCPVDVLLQRIGRLHRDPTRSRPLGFSRPRTVVLTPEEGLDPLIRPGPVRGPHGIGTVYEDLAILEATLRLVKDTWTIPEMNRLLVESATHPEQLAELTRELGPDWIGHREHIIGRTVAAGVIASLNTIDRSRPYPRSRVSDEHDVRIQTRLGEGDRLVTFAPAMGPFGTAVKELRLPYFLARNAPTPADPPEVEVIEHDGGFSFGWGGLDFTYDRFGLRLTP